MNKISASQSFRVLLTAGLFLAAAIAEALQPGVSKIEDSDAIDAQRSHLEAYPEISMARFRLARLLGQAGRYDEALAEFNSLLNDHPNNVDFVLGRAQIYSWQLNDEAALTDLERARKLAPDYEAVWQLQYRLLARRQDASADGGLTALRKQAALKFPEADWWQHHGMTAVTSWQLTIGGALETLSNDLPDWSNQFLQLSWMPGGNHRYFGRVVRDARFGNSDKQLAAGGEWILRDIWTAGLELTATRGAVFQPETGYSLHAGRRFASGWGGGVRWQRRQYATATVSIYSVVAERYFGNYRAAYSLHNSHLHGADDSIAHSLALDWYISDKHSLRISVADGEEDESVAARQILRTDVSNVTLSGRHVVNPRLTLTWWTGSHRQGSLYRRNYAGLALICGL